MLLCFGIFYYALKNRNPLYTKYYIVIRDSKMKKIRPDLKEFTHGVGVVIKDISLLKV